MLSPTFEPKQALIAEMEIFPWAPVDWDAGRGSDGDSVLLVQVFCLDRNNN